MVLVKNSNNYILSVPSSLKKNWITLNTELWIRFKHETCNKDNVWEHSKIEFSELFVSDIKY